MVVDTSPRRRSPPTPNPAGCMESQIQRRRRASGMCSCRRRSNSDQPGWTCSGNNMVADTSPRRRSPPTPNPAGCVESQIQRRRRASGMCSCRRRSNSDQPGWTCSGNNMVVDTSPRRRRSSSCAERLNDYSKRNAACIVVKDGKVLLVKANYFKPSGSWDLPGGYRDGNEHACKTAERETCEEGQIDVKAVAKTSVGSVYRCEYLGPTKKNCRSPEGIQATALFS